MKKAAAASVLLLILSSVMVSYVLASPDPTSGLFVWPVDATETGEPIVTISPADMQIFVVSPQKNSSNVWLLLSLNNETYEGLQSIEITDIIYGDTGETGTPVTYIQDDFTQPVSDPYDNADKIPVVRPEDATWPPVVQSLEHPYPGCQKDERQQVSTFKTKLGAPQDEPIYYSIAYVFDHVTTVPTNFTITVHTSDVSNLKVLVMAFGCAEGLPKYTGALNIHSSWSQASLIVIPELATMLLATAAIAAVGIYKVKRRK